MTEAVSRGAQLNSTHSRWRSAFAEEVWQLQPKVVQTVQQNVSYEFT